MGNLDHAATDSQVLAGDPGCVIRCQVEYGRGDVIGLTDSPQWCHGLHLCSEFTLGDPGCVQTFGFDHARADGIDTNLTWPKFSGKSPGDGIDRALGRGIGQHAGDGTVGDDGTDVDDAATV